MLVQQLSLFPKMNYRSELIAVVETKPCPRCVRNDESITKKERLEIASMIVDYKEFKCPSCSILYRYNPRSYRHQFRESEYIAYD